MAILKTKDPNKTESYEDIASSKKPYWSVHADNYTIEFMANELIGF